MKKLSLKANNRAIFKQGMKNDKYLMHLYNLFKNFVLTLPVIY